MKEEKIKLFIEQSMRLAPGFRRNIIKPKEYCEGIKLSPHQHLCLLIIHQNNMISMSDLAQKLGVSNQQLTRIMDYLVKNQLVKRYTSQENRRVVLAEVTDEGASLLKNRKEKMLEHFSQAFEKLTEEELDECIAHLEAVNRILDQIET